ncbi:hypothetical protein CRG98_042770 [Punica granatum]|uniref:Uncharacterized protein n=1 Tax=Punica granatum TaxID=22663 RepID=A0A2I0HYQ2_PUNGR|nr:hypothetical protein CRG98_042770 [Punica granatum]
MKYSSKHSIFNALLSTCCLSVLCIADDFDFLYFVQQISDLISSLEKSWPTLSCPSKNGLKFWAHEWVKHGTCSESELDQHDYFEAGLKLKEKMDLLQALNNAGIEPNDKFYSLESIKEAIKETVSHEPGIECNVDPSGNKQLSEVYLSFQGLALSQDFDFFYFTQQWPGCCCDTEQSCCYPATGKPAADFGIYGLWPNYNSGSYPSNCHLNSPFNLSEVAFLFHSEKLDCAKGPEPSTAISYGYYFTGPLYNVGQLFQV